MYTYIVRPGYGSDELLIEFINGPEKQSFFTDLKTALDKLDLIIESTEDIWMNDEIFLNITSNVGKFILSKDIWDLAFIMAEENQEAIKSIDQQLNNNKLFNRKK